MKNSILYYFTCLFLAVTACSDDKPFQAGEEAHGAEAPNIVFILADDIGFGDLGCYGHPNAMTPNLDSLAAEGILYRSFYVTGATCVPSRTGFMTGKDPASFPLYMKEHGFQGRTTITEILDSAGYETGHFGKWSIGEEPQRGEKVYGLDKIRIMESDLESPDGRDAKIFDAAIDFIEKSEGPFYANIWCMTSHFPVNPNDSVLKRMPAVSVDPQDFGHWFNKEKIDVVLKDDQADLDLCMRKYLSEIYALDRNIGKLIKALKEKGIYENTILAFSSDQGPGPVEASKDLSERKERLKNNMLGYSGGLRGGKHNFYEGGVRVPLIITYPNRIDPGLVDSTSIISGLDWLPTICSLLDINVDTAYFDGQVFTQTWKGVKVNRTEPLFWKKHNSENVTVRWQKWKFHQTEEGNELYNLKADPFEMRNIIDQNLNIEEHMLKAIEEWRKQL